jgi:hypothetical protein
MSMTYILKPVTENSWILQKDGVRLAIITRKDDQLSALGKLGRNKFNDIKDLSGFLQANVRVEEKIEDDDSEVLGDIKGYPVKHQAVIPVVDFDTLPVYKRGKVPHSAGYYGIRFKNGWVTSFCPKLSTLEENEYIGPFRTKLEMLNSISQKKRESDI